MVAAEDRLTLAVDDDAFTLNGACAAAPPAIWHLAADAAGRRCFDGKLEEPFAYTDGIAETAAAGICRAERADAGDDAPTDAEDAAAEAEFRRLIDDPPAGSPLVHFAQMWHALHGRAGPPDRTFDLRGARLVNAPALAVTGRHWDDDTTDFRGAPDEYAAVHFHADDLDDAGWEPCCALEIPAELVSGVYAFELRAGELTDHVPFVVRPPTGSVQADVVLLLPTLTYQVYGNERLIAAGGDGMAPAPLREVHLDPADRWLAAHPEAGASCYDLHPDGHGISLVSMRRPIPNLRPSFVWWLNDSPERFAADLYLVDWLEQHQIAVRRRHRPRPARGGALPDRGLRRPPHRHAPRVLHADDARRARALRPRGGGQPHVPRRQRLLLGDEHRSRASAPGGGTPRHQRHPRLVVAAGRAAPPDDRRAGRPLALPGARSEPARRGRLRVAVRYARSRARLPPHAPPAARRSTPGSSPASRRS